MHILHAHYQPENPGGILFWAETSDVPAPKQGRTSAAKKTNPACTHFVRIQPRSKVFSISMARPRPPLYACLLSAERPCLHLNSSTTGIWIFNNQPSIHSSLMGFGGTPLMLYLFC